MVIKRSRAEKIILLFNRKSFNLLLSIDGFPASSIAAGKVAALAHELGDDTMEGGALVAEALLARAQGTEILYARKKEDKKISLYTHTENRFFFYKKRTKIHDSLDSKSQHTASYQLSLEPHLHEAVI